MTRRIISIFNLLIYLFFFLGGLILIGSMIFWMNNNSAEGFEVLGVVLVAIILIGVGIVYSALGVFPIIFKGISIWVRRIVFPILCLPFDILYVLASLVLAMSSIIGGEPSLPLIIIGLLLTVISIVSAALNISCIALRIKEVRRAKGAVEIISE
jgi:hypothetical protein